MPPETPIGETPVVTDPKNNANPVVTPAVNTPDPEVERLRKEAEQATMRANQLANQLKAKEDAEAAARAKDLEEQNKFKDLYEDEKAKRLKAESDKEAADRQTAIKAESDKLFNEFPKEVRELADDTGLTLTDTDDDTVAAFKDRLDRISKKVGVQKITPNNPGNPTPSSVVSPNDMHAIMSDPVKFAEYVQKNLKTVAPMMRQTSE